MKVLVVGAQGMLAQDVVPTLMQRGHEVVTCDRQALPGRPFLDITDLATTQDMVMQVRPDLVLNCAAYTNVDAAETDEAAAYRVNALGPWNLALACVQANTALMHISTDYVFDGQKGGAYDEFDRTNPLGVYGRSKWAGEEYIRQLLSRFYIVRTAWLYGRHGKNFVETILKAGKERPELRVVNDQWGCPTWTVDLARALVQLAESGRYGTYHATGQGVCTWFDFASRILSEGGISTPVLPQTTEELGRPAPRPRYSVLRNRGLELAGFEPMPAWEKSLERYLTERTRPIASLS